MAIAPTNPSATNVLVTSMGALLFLFLSPQVKRREVCACSDGTSKETPARYASRRFRCHVREPNGPRPRGVSKRKRKSESMELRDDASQKSRAPSELCTA